MNRGRSPQRTAGVLVIAALLGAAVVPRITTATPDKPAVTERSVRQYMQALASDEMRGRGSATADELAAARYIASQMQLLRVKPAGDNGDYLQTVQFTRRVRGAPDQTGTPATTTNVIGILRGRDPVLTKETILLSAHLDHLGIGREVNGDSIY